MPAIPSSIRRFSVLLRPRQILKPLEQISHDVNMGLQEESVSQLPTLLLVAGGLAALLLVFKPLYEKRIRFDSALHPDQCPVLQKLQLPVHASHRGGSLIRPENTLLAFRNAVEGVDSEGVVRKTQVLEFDIQKTKDGQLVIMHNLHVDETTNGTGPVSEYSLEEIRQLDAGYRFSNDGGETFPFRGQGVQVPTLKEIFEEFVPRQDLVFYLDFKQPEGVAETMQMVREFGIEERIICGAVPPDANREVLRLKPKCAPASPDIHSMIIMYAFYKLGLLWVLPMRFEIVGTTAHRWGYKVLTLGLVNAFHRRNRRMAVFGEYIDLAEGQLDCLALGCDILVTDRPDVLHSTLDTWHGRKGYEGRKEA